MFQRTLRTGLRRGFTVIELLVSIGVISLLIAILMSAVQSARETSRRMECMNRMRQIMQATTAFETNRQRFPEYSCGGEDRQGKRHLSICPLVQILPFIDQANVFQRVDHNEMVGFASGYQRPSALSAKNMEFMTLTIPIYQCPSDRTLPGSCNYRANLGSGADWYTFPPAPPFQGCIDPKNGNGAFEMMQALSPSRFTDGLSNTAMFSERVIGDGDPSQYDPWRDYSQVDDAWPHCRAEQLRSTCRDIAGIAAQHASFSGFTWFYATKAQTAYDHISPPNSRIPDCAHDALSVAGATNSAIAARSQHPGIVNVAMGDGSIRTVAESIDLEVWRQMGSRNGND